MKRARRGRMATALLALVLAAAGPPTAPITQDLQDAERKRAAETAAQQDAAARASVAAAEERRLGQAQETALARLREAEGATDAAAGRVEELARRRRDAEARLAQRAGDLTPLLPLLERLSRYPAETLLALPLPPEDAVRGALVIGGITTSLEQEAAALRAEQAQVATLQAQLDAEVPKLTQAQTVQAAAAAALDEQLRFAQTQRRSAEDEAAGAAQRAADDAARAETLRAAIGRIEAEQRAAEEQARREADEAARQRRQSAAAAARQRQEALARPAGPGLEGSHGQLTAPVAGRVVRGFGEATDAGPAVGVTYRPAPAARVVAPCSGRVVFAAPFRSYGLLLIIDCGRGYHVVLAGFERLDAAVGRPVAAGAPVGVMPDWDPRGAGNRPSLYVELRHDGQAVNPAPLLAGHGS
jgi:septal ring factor EnvC (AmiA/AmiB activator)